MKKRRKYHDTTSTAIPEPNSLVQGASAKQSPRRSSVAFGVLLPLRIAGAMIVAVALMSVLMIVLAWGTFVESEYGTAVVKFALYDSAWFALLLLLLGINIFCSVLLRFPWKPSHWPFVVIHVGILVLLVGCFFTWSYGQEAMLSIHEGAAGKYAMKLDRQHFELRSISYTAFGDTHDSTNSKNAVSVPFEPGPFNWDDYLQENWYHGSRKFRDSLRLAMKWGRRDTGRLTLPSAASGIQVEVLDYHASSTTQPVPPMELSVLWKRPVRTVNELGDVREAPRTWETVKFDIRRREHPGAPENRGSQMQTVGGERINFFSTNSPAEVEAFRAADPNPRTKTGVWGQIVLHHAQKNHYFDVDRLLGETQEKNRVPLGETGFSIGDVRLLPRGPALRLTVYAPNGEKESLALFAALPDWNVHARQFGVFGTYWLDPDGPLKKDPGRTELSVLENMSNPRLDILQGPNRALYYRFWTGRSLASSGEILVNPSGTEKPKFIVAQGTDDEAEFVVDRFSPQDLPGQRIVPLPVGKQRGSEQRVKLRVNVDGNEDVFWIRAAYPSIVPLPPESDQVRYVYGNGRTVRVTWNYDRVDLGFGIFLKQFEKRSEPGSRMAASYSSLVDFVKLNDSVDYTTSSDDFKILQENVLIRMNRPAVFQSSMLSNRYRIYQSSYEGPYRPNDIRFQDLYDGNVFSWEKMPRESLYISKLSVNDDPGRGLKYLGCFLFVFGSLWLLYRRS